MTRIRALDIEEWRQVSLVAGEAGRCRTFVSPRILGLVGTLVLHAFVLQSVLTRTQIPTYRPRDVQRPGTTEIHPETETSDTLLLIDLPGATTTDAAPHARLASLGSATRESFVALISEDPLPSINIPRGDESEDQKAIEAAARDDSAARAVLFGRYTGQINARIERVWRRPRSPVTSGEQRIRDDAINAEDANHPSDDTFNCQVRIIQDRAGNVQEVQVLRCNGSVAWQHSLIMAILTASPLPSPPNPAVFSEALTMTFAGHIYTTQSSAEEYELEPRSSAATSGPSQVTHVSN